MIFNDYWKFCVLNLSEMRNTVLFEPESWWKKIFTNYWIVLVFNFLGVGNTVFFSPKKSIERWYLVYLFELSIIFHLNSSKFVPFTPQDSIQIFIKLETKLVCIKSSQGYLCQQTWNCFCWYVNMYFTHKNIMQRAPSIWILWSWFAPTERDQSVNEKNGDLCLVIIFTFFTISMILNYTNYKYK